MCAEREDVDSVQNLPPPPFRAVEAEKKRSFEMELKVRRNATIRCRNEDPFLTEVSSQAKTLGDKLEKNRKALEEIERQRSEAENRCQSPP